MEKIELKPGPFCGCEATIFGSKDAWFVKCKECGGTQFVGNTKKRVVEAWNRRADDELEL